MIKTRMLNVTGITVFSKWLVNPVGGLPPAELVDSDAMTETFGYYEIDESMEFGSRFELGLYLNKQLDGANFNGLMAQDSDGLWAWLAVIYFRQLSEKGIRRAEHYVVTRKGSAGSLAYRQAIRTSYELVRIHGEYAQICLKRPMHTYGELTEQLTSRQTIAHNKGFFQTAYNLYISGGKLKRGASSKPKKLKDRKPGDRTGLGSVRRLAIALQRLDLTHDTEYMDSEQMKAVLPKEFSKWTKSA